MNQVEEYIEQLVKEYNYKKLPLDIAAEAREFYLQNLPTFLDLNGEKDNCLYNSCNNLITKGYERVVIGDYGAFIEFNMNQSNETFFKCKVGQEYRINDINYRKNIKYFWITTRDDSDIKIYYQQKTVNYADYKIGKFYISPYECKILIGEN